MINAMDTLPSWLSMAVMFFLLLGSVIVVIGAFGLLRLPNFYQRIHGPAITITLGAGCLLIASMIYFTGLQSRLVIHELLISAFLLLTAPVTSMLIMRAAVYRDLRAGRVDKTTGDGDAYHFPREE